ncbi:hypothetical protein KQI84_15165 [bacterium]|nr:hypothetical protein [bacterium]
MRIIHLEDDYPHSELVRRGLGNAFPDLTYLRILTESEFNEKIASLLIEPPDIFLLDMMVGWADPTSGISRHGEWGFMSAGTRAAKLIGQHSSDVPIIIYTALAADSEEDQFDLGELTHRQVMLMHKDFDMDKLVKSVRLMIKRFQRV